MALPFQAAPQDCVRPSVVSAGNYASAVMAAPLQAGSWQYIPHMVKHAWRLPSAMKLIS